MLTKEDKCEIKAAIQSAIRAALKDIIVRMPDEWITEDELCKRYQMFTKSGMKSYGKYIPQAQAQYKDNDTIRETRTVYSINAVQKMILDDDLDFTRIGRREYRKERKTN